MTVDADVVVAGGGPAGALAARALAKAGIHTLLVDRAAFPRNKPCGGGLSVRALRRFPWLEPALSGIDIHRISKLHLHDRYTIRNPEDGANFIMEEMRLLSQEHFVCLYLNTKNQILHKQTIFIGSLNSSIVHPREIVRP